MAAVVLAQLHVSCFVTAANRATPVFDVQPERRCLRVVSRPPGSAIHSDAVPSPPSQLSVSAPTPTPTPPTPTVAGTAAASEPPTAEWEFHSVFASSQASTALAAHGNEFFRDITVPAMQSVLQDGTNTNIIATGVHPTQKFRLLFGKTASASSAPTIIPTPTPTVAENANSSSPVDPMETLEAHGQLGTLLCEFFTREDASDWRVGLSSWILVHNTAIDLLKPSPTDTDTASSSATAAPTTSTPFTFVSVEVPRFSTALRVLQTAKTHRVVMKHTAEHSHFFVRLAFFHAPSGQLSTLHLVDLMDLKDCRDAVATQEKHELYEILQDLRRQTQAAAAIASKSPHKQSKPPPPTKTLLATFLQPLLTSNARTFLYANVIDSRASLRESVALLNAVANVKGFACVCKKRTGIAYTQLGFQPAERDDATLPSAVDQASLDAAAAKAMAAVVIGESLLNRLAASPAPSVSARVVSSSSSAAAAAPVEQQATMASPVVTSDALSWLDAFKQRKQSILATTTTRPSQNELPLGRTETTHPYNQQAPVAPLSSQTNHSSSSDLYARLMETMQGVHTPPTQAGAPHVPLPIEDPIDSHLLFPPPPLPPAPSSSSTASIYNELAARLATPIRAQSTALEAAGLPSEVPRAPSVDGLDPTTAAKIHQADTALLRQNYDALLTVVREQQLLREAAEAKASELAQDKAELETQYQVQLEQSKLELVALRSKVRWLERQSGCVEVFDQYEDERQRLQREVHQLRSQNVELELRLVAAAEEPIGFSTSSATGSITELKRRYQAVCEDKNDLEKLVAELRKKERQFEAQRRLIHESTRKVDRLARELHEKDDALVSTRLGEKRRRAEMALAQREAQQFQQENERLLIEKAATTEELLAAKMHLASVESEQKKAEILDKFMRKHGGRLQRGRDHNRIVLMDGESGWRRDALTRDLEDKLMVGVKRSVPQLVPIATKVLRKLETQDLSLHEYAEREADLIHLLVGLASDQPAVALKAMIEDELHKLALF